MIFVESAFRHGYSEEDFREVLEAGGVSKRSQRGLDGVYEVLGRNYAGEYLHIVYRREVTRTVVFHIRRMTDKEKRRFRYK